MTDIVCLMIDPIGRHPYVRNTSPCTPKWAASDAIWDQLYSRWSLSPSTPASPSYHYYYSKKKNRRKMIIASRMHPLPTKIPTDHQLYAVPSKIRREMEDCFLKLL